jgi:hypothetical protein
MTVISNTALRLGAHKKYADTTSTPSFHKIIPNKRLDLLKICRYINAIRPKIQ